MVAGLRRLLERRRLEREMRDELLQHVELEVADRVRAGMTAAEARRTALRDFGAEDRWLEEARAIRGWRPVDELRQDARYAWRGLRRSPSFAVVAIATLALAIGATTLVFSVVDGVLLRPFAYDADGRLARLKDVRLADGASARGTISYANFADMRAGARYWEAAAAYDEWQVALVENGSAQRIDAALVDASWFDVLGVQPALGRFFLPEEAEPGSAQVVVLSWGLWQERYGGDPAVLNRTIEANGVTRTIVGVAPRGLEDPGLSGGSFGTPRMWGPAASYFATNSRGSRSFTALIRLRSGVTLSQAQEEVEGLQQRLVEQYPENNEGYRARLVPLLEDRTGSVRAPLLMLLGAVALVLLIACANVANLLLMRGTVRRREVEVRAALGAARARIVRQLLVESMVLAALGSALGLMLAAAGLRTLRLLLAGRLPRLELVHLDARVFLFAAGVTLAAALLFGLVPAFQMVRTQLAAGLRAGGRVVGSGVRGVRALIIGTEVAVAVVVLVAAGLLVRSLVRLESVDPGLDAHGALALQLLTPPDLTDATLTAYYDVLFDRLAAVPGVDAVGTLDVLPLSGGFNGGPFTIAGRPEPAREDRPNAEVRAAAPGVFAALGLPLVRGRLLEPPDDREDAAPAVVIDETAARQYWPGEDPVGTRITFGDRQYEVVGVVGGLAHFALDRAREPTLYFPNAQAPAWMRDDPALVVRTSVDALSVSDAIVSAIRDVNPRVAIAGVRPLDRVLADTLALPRFRTLLLAAFALIALLLALIGIYGTVSYTVERRTAELGVRVALGASPAGVLALVLRDGFRPVIAGVVFGLAAALAVTRLLAGMLFQLSPLDPPTFLAVALVLALVAAAAMLAPARRAAATSPMTVLRAD
ncbi:MAG TPA: ABC transporter permease [Longimicrobiales bacterium]